MFPSKDDRISKIDIKVPNSDGSKLFIRPISEIVLLVPSQDILIFLKTLFVAFIHARQGVFCYEVANVLLSETNFIHVGQNMGRPAQMCSFQVLQLGNFFFLLLFFIWTKTLLNSSGS